VGRLTKIVVRNDTSTNWVSKSPSPQLLEGEIGLENNTGRFKIGRKNLVTGELFTWNELGYAAEDTSNYLIPGVSGGTGVNNGNNKIILGGNLTTSGGNITLISTGTAGDAIVTLPSSGTIANADGSNFSDIPKSKLAKYAIPPKIWYSTQNDLSISNGGGLFGHVNGVQLEKATIYELDLVWVGKYIGNSGSSTGNASANGTLTFLLPTNALLGVTVKSIMTSTLAGSVNGNNSIGLMALGPNTRNSFTDPSKPVLEKLIPVNGYGTSKYVTLRVSGVVITKDTTGYFNPSIVLKVLAGSTVQNVTTYAGSYMSLRPIGSSTTTYKGDWS